MRAVNLLPADRRREAATLAGRSGGAHLVILAGLVGLLVMAALFAIARHDEADNRSQLGRVSQQADAANAQATALAPYTQFATLRAQRQQAITAVSVKRVNWALAIRQIVGVLPGDVHLLTMTGLGPGAAATAGPAPPGTPAPNTAGPSVDVVGCASSHTKVADVINLLRGIQGNPHVSLASSVKSTPAQTAHTTAGCGSAPQFDLTVEYQALPGRAPATVTPLSPSTGLPAR